LTDRSRTRSIAVAPQGVDAPQSSREARYGECSEKDGRDGAGFGDCGNGGTGYFEVCACGAGTKSVVEEGEKRKVAPEGALAPVIEPAEKRASL